MTTDLYGLALTANDPTPINDFVHGLIAFQPKAVNILKSASSEPDSALVPAYAAWLMMFGEATDSPARARPFLDQAKRLPANPRETAAVQAAQLWIEGDIPALVRLCEDTVMAYPRDMAMLKLGQYHLFNLGDFAGMLRIATKAFPDADDIAHAHAMLSFGYEECHLLDQAEAAAQRALEIDPSEPWAHHTIAHVALTRGDVADGVAFLEGVSHHWDGLNSFMHSHNWWHLALFYLSLGQPERVLEIYDTHVWGIEPDYSQDQIGAASLLARMEFAGINVGTRWHDVAGRIAKRGADTVSPFMTLQYLYALGRTNSPASEPLLAAIEDRADAPAHDQSVWRDVALWAAHGIAAHAAGDYDDAIRFLGKALPRLSECGGSHAQRDLFEQIYLDALIHADRVAQAQQLLEQRRAFDPAGVPLNRLLARVYERNGLPDLAAAALNRIS
jgi:tetratricopeptide (TPR) repeat protein